MGRWERRVVVRACGASAKFVGNVDDSGSDAGGWDMVEMEVDSDVGWR